MHERVRERVEIDLGERGDGTLHLDPVGDRQQRRHLPGEAGDVVYSPPVGHRGERPVDPVDPTDLLHEIGELPRAGVAGFRTATAGLVEECAAGQVVHDDQAVAGRGVSQQRSTAVGAVQVRVVHAGRDRRHEHLDVVGLVGLSAGLVTVVALSATALVFEPRQWPVYAAANLLVAAVYALLGVVLGPLVGRVAGVFIAFLVPFLDLGLVQSPMLGDPPGWGHLLPGWGAYQVLSDGAFTAGFDQVTGLAVSAAWLVALTVATPAPFRPIRVSRPAGRG